MKGVPDLPFQLFFSLINQTSPKHPLHFCINSINKTAEYKKGKQRARNYFKCMQIVGQECPTYEKRPPNLR